MPSTPYAGLELDVFARAVNWKAYVRQFLSGYLRGHVLEVGAGIGGTTRALRSSAQERWVALEPSVHLARQISRRASSDGPAVEVIAGTIDAIRYGPFFDCILYFDVLEHIEDDRREIAEALRRLRPDGVVVVLSPAYQFLYTPFDAALGHYRRYDRRQLEALTPAGATLVSLRYVDAFSLLLTLGNKLLLRSAEATDRQVQLWDRWCVPISTRLDRVLGGRVGKSVLAIWRR